VANWELIGEIVVSNDWQSLPVLIGSEVFRITTTIQSLDDWNIWKFKSAAYLQFRYFNEPPTNSIAYYIKVLESPTVYEFKIPEQLKVDGWILRTPLIKRASRYLPITPNDMFAEWKFKLEAFG
jgi:hypothetical protein